MRALFFSSIVQGFWHPKFTHCKPNPKHLILARFQPVLLDVCEIRNPKTIDVLQPKAVRTQLTWWFYSRSNMRKSRNKKKHLPCKAATWTVAQIFRLTICYLWNAIFPKSENPQPPSHLHHPIPNLHPHPNPSPVHPGGCHPSAKRKTMWLFSSTAGKLPSFKATFPSRSHLRAKSLATKEAEAEATRGH